MLAVVGRPAPRVITDFPEPRRTPGDALVRLRVAGICDTDLQLCRGYMEHSGVLGHEFVGEVVESDDPSWRGARVVADINAGCGVCPDCTRGNAHHCRTRTVLGIVGQNGAMAERFVVPQRCLVRVPSGVPDDAAVFAEPLAAALHVDDDVPRTSSPVAVLGDGKLGQLIARALACTGRRTILVGHHQDKLALARAAGIEGILESAIATDLDGIDAVVEATGSPAGVALALRLVRPRGTVVLKTTIAGTTALDLSPVVVNEVRIVGSRCGDMGRAMDALAAGRIDPTNLIAARYPLARAVEALGHASRRGTLKVLVDAPARDRATSEDRHGSAGRSSRA